ncbi:M23 family metallopeptidase [Microbacterium sp. 1P10UB]|uniref:M23 family metallopeptidase n=1 Tax=unclassified Microbacterium TaxID=2609290 RepID=UPI0039A3D584
MIEQMDAAPAVLGSIAVAAAAVAADSVASGETSPAAAPLSRRARRAQAPVVVPEPTTTAEPVAVSVPPTSTADAIEDDAFAAAARALSFTGETAIIAPVVTEPAPLTAPVHVAPRRVRRSTKRLTAASFSVGVMGIVGLLAVGMTTPVSAVAAATGSSDVASTSYQAPAGDVVSAAGAGEIQAYVAPAQYQNTTIDRPGSYDTARLVDLAGVEGISNYSNSVFTNNPACPIQWPFATGVTMSYGFGMRDGTMHEGVDFTPGDGAYIQAISAGTVRISTDSGGAFGVTIVIDHIVDGQLVSSRYGHMQYGSRQVEVGDTVEVGEYIGRTGDTGRSFGAHTHVEILAGGTTPIDPLPWFQQHATC